eukprot:1043653-Prorocentrum_lima.AAC.1
MDVSSAFPSLDRAAMYRTLEQEKSPLAQAAACWYHEPAPKVWRDNTDAVHVFSSTTGIDQGDPLATSMFNVAVA